MTVTQEDIGYSGSRYGGAVGGSKIFIPNSYTSALTIYDTSLDTIVTKYFPLSNTYRSECSYYNGVFYAKRTIENANAIDKYTVATDSFASKACAAASRIVSLLVGDKIYLPRTSEAYMDIYDLTGDTISTVAIPSGQRSCAAHYNGKVYLPRAWTSSLDIYDIAAGTYVTKTMSASGSCAQIAVYNGKIYILQYAGTSVDVYDPVTDSMTTLSGLPSRNRNYGSNGAFVRGTRLYTLNSSTHTILDFYDFATATWGTYTLPNYEHRCAFFGADNKVYLPRMSNQYIDVLSWYHLTYNSNGATGGASPTDSKDYDGGETVTVLGNPGSLVKTGYRWTGWNTNGDGSGTHYDADDTLTMPSSNLTLYAEWTQAYNVNYQANGATSGSVPVDPIDYLPGENATVLGNTGSLTKTGYAFMGWNTNSEGSGDHYDPDDPYLMIAGDATLLAEWREIYTVTYNDNDADSGDVPAEAEYLPDDTVVIAGNTGALVKAGYTFCGWSDYPGGGTFYAPGSSFSMPYQDVTLYAWWGTNDLQIQYIAGRGTTGDPPVDENYYEYGDGATILGNTGNIEKSGWRFIGWNTQETGGGTHYDVGGTVVMGVSSINLWAEFALEQYVVYSGNGSTEGEPPNDPTTYIDGETVTVLGNTGGLGKTGNVFVGWNTQADGLGTHYDADDTFPYGAA